MLQWIDTEQIFGHLVSCLYLIPWFCAWQGHRKLPSLLLGKYKFESWSKMTFLQCCFYNCLIGAYIFYFENLLSTHLPKGTTRSFNVFLVQWWNVTWYIYSGAVLKCKFKILVFYLSIFWVYAALYLYSNPSHRWNRNVLLHSISLPALVLQSSASSSVTYTLIQWW